MVNLVTRPKTTILGWVDRDKSELLKPIVFVALCVAIGFLLQVPRLAMGQSVANNVAGMATFKVVALVLASAIIQGLFKTLGGKGGFLETFSVYLYIVGPLYIVSFSNSPRMVCCANLAQSSQPQFALRI